MDDPINLSALRDPDDAASENRFAYAVMSRVREREQLHPSPAASDYDAFAGIWSMIRPVAIAASVITATAVGVVLQDTARAATLPGGPRTIAEAIGVPPMFLASSNRRGQP